MGEAELHLRLARGDGGHQHALPGRLDEAEREPLRVDREVLPGRPVGRDHELAAVEQQGRRRRVLDQVLERFVGARRLVAMTEPPPLRPDHLASI